MGECYRILTQFLAKHKFKEAVDSVAGIASDEEDPNAVDSNDSGAAERESLDDAPGSDADSFDGVRPHLSSQPAIDLRGFDDSEVLDFEENANENANDEGEGDASGADQEELYNAELEKTAVKISVIEEQTLDISLKDFEAVFINDNAPYNYKRYHESVNDKVSAIDNWENVSDGQGKHRDMKFFKPVNLPGLKDTRV